MVNKNVFEQGMEKLNAEKSEETTSVVDETVTDEPVETPAAAVETKEPAEETNPDEKSDDAVESKGKKRKNSMEARLNQKHAQLMAEKEARAAEKQDFEAKMSEITKQIESLKSAQSPATAEDEFVLDDVDDLQNYLKKVVTVDQLESAVDKLVNAKLNAAKETIEQETSQKAVQTMQNDFMGQMVLYYNPEQDPDFALKPDEVKEAQQMMELFNGNPRFYLKMAKDKGVPYIRRFVNGELAAETQATKNKKIIDSANAVRTNTPTTNEVKPYDDGKPPKSWKNVFERGAEKMKKGA